MSDEKYNFQWQNPFLLETIYPLREMKLRDFLVLFYEIDHWKESRAWSEEELNKRTEDYKTKQASAIKDMVDLFYCQQEYFKSTEVRAVYQETSQSPEKCLKIKKFNTLDDDVIKKIETLHGAFKTYLPGYNNIRKEKIFVAGRIMTWEQYLKQVTKDVVKQRVRVNTVAEASREEENQKLNYLETVVLPMVKEEFDQLNSFVSSYNKIEKRKQELDEKRKGLLAQKEEIMGKIKGQRKKIRPVEVQHKELLGLVNRLKQPPSLEKIKEHFSVDHFKDHVSQIFQGTDQKLRSSFENLRKAVDLIIYKTSGLPVKLVYIRTEIEKMKALKEKFEDQIDHLEDELNALTEDSERRPSIQIMLTQLREVNLKEVVEELDELEDLKAVIEFGEIKDVDRASLINQKGKEIIELEKNRLSLLAELKKMQEDLEPINRELAIPEKENLKRYAPDKEITKNDVVMDDVEVYRASLEKLDHQGLLEAVVNRFLDPEALKTRRYPLWLQYMVIHFSGMRYSSAHGSWADPRELLFNLRTDEIQRDFRGKKDDNTIESICESILDYYDSTTPKLSGVEDPIPVLSKLRDSKNPDENSKFDDYIKGLASANQYERRKTLLNLNIEDEKYEVDTLKDEDVLEALRAYHTRKENPIPDWMWDEIVKLTDLRVQEVKDKGWETLNADEVRERNSSASDRYREIMNKWKADNLTEWRKEHDRTGQLIVTRAVCNEVAEHIQHLRGHEGAAGLTAKPAWYMGEEAKYQENITPRAYFVLPRAEGDFKVGASLLWLRFVQDEPNEWRIATPLKTAGGDRLIPDKYMRTNPGLGEWGYQMTEPILRRRSVQRGIRIGKEVQYLRWMHEATVAEVAETAEGTVVLTFETALPHEDRRLSTIGVFKRYPIHLLSDLGEDNYNPAFVGYIPDGQHPIDAMEDMLDWNAILQRERLSPADLEKFRNEHIRVKVPPPNYGSPKAPAVKVTPEEQAKAFVPPGPDSKIFEVLRWGDKELVDLLGASVSLIEAPSNFQTVKLAGKDSRGRADFNDIKKYQIVDYDYLRSLQYEQEGKFGNINQIMNWLVNHGAEGVRPYWMKGTKTLYFGTIVFGGQLIEVEAVNGVAVEYRFDAQYPNRPSNIVEKDQVFYKLQGLRRSEMGKVSYKTHPYKIQRATMAGKNENKYSDLPRGTEIFHPVWDPRDWPCNLHGGVLFIAAKFVKEFDWKSIVTDTSTTGGTSGIT